MQHHGDVIFEFIQLGAYIKVTAVDAQTGLEVSSVGAAGTPQHVLQKNALRKLRHVQNKKK